MENDPQSPMEPERAIYSPVESSIPEEVLLAFNSIRHDYEGVRIGLGRPSQEIYEIFFPSVIAFMFRDEGDAYATIQEIHPPSLGVHHIFRVTGSGLMRFFWEQSGWRNERHSHWVILSLDAVIDVIAMDPPLVRKM